MLYIARAIFECLFNGTLHIAIDVFCGDVHQQLSVFCPISMNCILIEHYLTIYELYTQNQICAFDLMVHFSVP